MMKVIFLLLFSMIAFSCHQLPATSYSLNTDSVELMKLEHSWLKAEFSLDTAFLSSIIDPSFIDISDEGIHNKEQAIRSMYENISKRLRDSIVIDSFELEAPIVHLYENSAVVVFVVHTQGRNKSEHTDRRTRFYDAWIKRPGKWKAVSSQGTPIP